MDGVGPAAFRGIKNLLDVEIRFSRGCATDSIGFVSLTYVQRSAVYFREHCYRSNAQFPACADDPHSNFAAIGNQDFLDHGALDHRNQSEAMIVIEQSGFYLARNVGPPIVPASEKPLPEEGLFWTTYELLLLLRVLLLRLVLRFHNNAATGFLARCNRFLLARAHGLVSPVVGLFPARCGDCRITAFGIGFAQIQQV